MSENMTLGRKMKIKHLAKQKRVLLEEVRKIQRDGDPSFSYSGYLFPEVKKYFEEQDYQVRTYDSPEFILKSGGCPLHVFLPKDDIILTDEETKEALEIL